MKVPLSWLREFVDVTDTPDEIAARLSVRGFAVEGIDTTTEPVFDFEVTANRPDCMSILGMAREVATAYELPLRDESAASTVPPSAAGTAESLRVSIADPALCTRYAGAVADVTVGPSPAWLQRRLHACGIRPISNIVDITNYVLLELGQPMHAFDEARLAGGEIRVRTARIDETLRTLDGQERTLTPEMLVIADAERPAAIAGVMGGAGSEVSETTRTIVFESAHFDPLSVRRTSRRLGLKTEASMRFERGADVEMVLRAMARAVALLHESGGGRARPGVVDCHPAARERSRLPLRRARIAALLGTEVPPPEVERILRGLGFGLETDAAGWQIQVPARRVDVRREVDLIEEIARHYGFDRLPLTFPALSSPPPPPDPRLARTRHLRSLLTGAGFCEAVTFGFISQAAATAVAPEAELVPIANPLSETFAVLRPSALPALVEAVAHNLRREQRDVRLFEIGNRFTRSGGERRALACAWTGSGGTADHWSGGARDVDFFDMKGVVTRICEAMRLDVRTMPIREPWLVPGRSAAVVHEGTALGVLGQLSPAVVAQHGMSASDAIFVAELDLDLAWERMASAPPPIDPLPRYPSVTRDVSILVDDTLPAEEVRATVRAAAPPTLVSVREFDRYQGKGIPEGKVSLSLRLTYRSGERTLTDGEVQAAMDVVIAALKTRHGATQR